MRKIIVTEKYDGKKLVNCILENFENLNRNMLYKALRQKDIKVNGKRVKENITLYQSDIVEIYISDKILNGNIDMELKVIYEDDNILVIYKPQGISVTDEVDIEETNILTLTKLVKNKFGTNLEPCHRLDRNTKGIILFSKNEESRQILFKKFKNHEIEKHYKAMVYRNTRL